ncbi:hypothetical protein PGT21_014923 [Puccinia graminis f. sp. tritici]|uniref:Uncharacterized protein n=1 Tax=Puccinia graminis f. sp. tritici TaxID=56615 RepID=A0A5B0PG33_PUCGR|nr:hypothetical protein PGTUg99_013564 [Puccinia graminis f. sp. tritici]KAA1099620.1 hypothetical protein PGT21_014923 [Puccinia graminis f. sp. tritici]
MFIRFAVCVLGLSALIQPAICLPVSTTRSIHSAVSRGGSDGQPDLFRREEPSDSKTQSVPLVERGSPSNGYYGPAGDSYADYDSPPKKAYSAPDAYGPPKKNPDQQKEGVLNTLLGGPVKLLGLDGSGGGLLGNVLSSGH